MSDISPTNTPIQQEAVTFRRAVSESFGTAVGGAINYALQQIPLLYAQIASDISDVNDRIDGFNGLVSPGALRLVATTTVSTSFIGGSPQVISLMNYGSGTNFRVSILAFQNSGFVTYQNYETDTGIAWAPDLFGMCTYNRINGLIYVSIYQIFQP